MPKLLTRGRFCYLRWSLPLLSAASCICPEIILRCQETLCPRKNWIQTSRSKFVSTFQPLQNLLTSALRFHWQQNFGQRESCHECNRHSGEPSWTPRFTTHRGPCHFALLGLARTTLTLYKPFARAFSEEAPDDTFSMGSSTPQHKSNNNAFFSCGTLGGMWPPTS